MDIYTRTGTGTETKQSHTLSAPAGAHRKSHTICNNILEGRQNEQESITANVKLRTKF